MRDKHHSNHCPTLAELPPPPPGRTGWPWTEGSEPLPEAMPDGTPWPRVSVVTPSYNQGQFLEETIRSVLLQGYPNLEYLIIDGGSTDDSVEVIHKYEPWLAYWVSERDNGQAHAINKGWQKATGAYVTWLNSDDTLLSEAIAKTARVLAASATTDLVFGNVYHIDPNSNELAERYGSEFAIHSMLVHWRNVTPQPGFLMRRAVLDRIGLLDTEFSFSMDFEYWLRLGVQGGILQYMSEFLANARMHPLAKTSRSQIVAAQEQIKILNKIFSSTELAEPIKALEQQARGAAHRSAAYWSYLANDASVTRYHAAQALRHPGKKWGIALVLWLISLIGDRQMARARYLWRKGYRRILPVGKAHSNIGGAV